MEFLKPDKTQIIRFLRNFKWTILLLLLAYFIYKFFTLEPIDFQTLSNRFLFYLIGLLVAHIYIYIEMCMYDFELESSRIDTIIKMNEVLKKLIESIERTSNHNTDLIKLNIKELDIHNRRIKNVEEYMLAQETLNNKFMEILKILRPELESKDESKEEPTESKQQK